MKRTFLLSFIILVAIFSCISKNTNEELLNAKKIKSMLSISIKNLEFKDWFQIHNDRFLSVKFENDTTLKKTYFLKKQFRKLYLVEGHGTSILNFFPLLENYQNREVVENKYISDIFPNPNVLNKSLIIHSWVNEKKDTLYAEFKYSYRDPHITIDLENLVPPRKSKDYTHKLKLALITGKIYISLGKNEIALW